MENSRPQREKTLTIGTYLDYLYPGVCGKKSPPTWPADVFALAASLLQRSGAYRTILTFWPPPNYNTRRWDSEMQKVGLAWRSHWNQRKPPPHQLRVWWREVMARAAVHIADLANDRELCNILVALCAAADEASFAVGLPSTEFREFDRFGSYADYLLVPREAGSTLCERIHPSRIRVLPKMHTPQSGLTIRSFSHNLALHATDEMQPYWFTVPNNPKNPVQNDLHLLLVPWPYTVRPDQFYAVPRSKCGMRNVSVKYGFFATRSIAQSHDVCDVVKRLLNQAERKFGHVDGVVLPELALTLNEYDRLSALVLPHAAFLVSGVNAIRNGSVERPGNYLRFDIPVAEGATTAELHQAKHHRWRLDGSQIGCYGLSHRLSRRKLWWEHVPIEDRTLSFVALRPWLAVAILICEDLARPDPVGDIVRAVGPNLIIALLMDGPQLSYRWSSRHAAVLADDPGSSVLTLTSLGMAELSHPGRAKCRRTIGLWKDPNGSPREIELPPEKEAAFLRLTDKPAEEWTADGRGDGGVTGCPVLSELKFL